MFNNNTIKIFKNFSRSFDIPTIFSGQIRNPDEV